MSKVSLRQQKFLPSLVSLFLLFIIFALAPRLAFGYGAYLVDDGGIVDAKILQIENWYSRSNTGEDVYVTNPTYQLLPNAEFAIQETYTQQGANNSLWPQVKYLWHDSKKIMSSVTVGTNYYSNKGKNYGSYAYSSTTVAFLEDMVDVHLYLGWQNWRHAAYNNKSTDFFNTGLGTEIHLDKDLSLTGEIFQANSFYRTGSKNPAVQLGSRYFLTKNILLDAIYGRNINGNNQNWFTFGVTLCFGD